MLIVNKKEFNRGVILFVSFLAILGVMFLPFFGGSNAFEASDRLFNTISKGSTYYIPKVLKENEEFMGRSVDVTIKLDNEAMVKHAGQLFLDAGASVSASGAEMKVAGDLGKMLETAVRQADVVFHNKGDDLAQKYGIHQREILYTWHKSFKTMGKALTKQEKFREAAWIEEAVKRSLEVAYNYFKIEPKSAGASAGILIFSLVFYVVYTMWWGFAILFLFEGIGLQMKAGKKKEV
jgi:hypothetical protein